MKRVAILASVLAMAIGSAYCSNSSGSSLVSPSSVDASAAATAARSGGSGGGGKGKPGGGGTTGGGSLAYVMVDDVNGDHAPNWGDTLTWTFTQTSTDTPTVNLVCSQNGVAVYGATGGFYASYPWPWTVNMKLGSSAWTGGAANCTATLTPVNGSPVLATYSFNAAP